MENKFNLEIKDCEPINHANIEINKLNVIGGVNASGKSTVSKVLYSFLRSKIFATKEFALNYVIFDINEIIDMSNKMLISMNLDKFGEISKNDVNEFIKGHEIELLNNYTLDDNPSEIIKTYKAARDNILEHTALSNGYKSYSECQYADNNFGHFFDEFNFSEYLNKFFLIDSLIKLILGNDDGYGYLMITEELFFYESVCKNGFFKLFNDSFEHMIENKFSNIALYQNNYYSYGTMEKFIDVLYIDSISIFDLYGGITLLEHNNRIINYLKEANELVRGSDFKLGEDITDLYDIDEKSLNIIQKFDKLVEGKFGIFSDSLIYNKKEETFPIVEGTLSSGFKQLAIIRLLLAINRLKENTFLIIDEPEVNLHPEWQIKFAEILVLLAKELDIYIYLNSHSPMFIEAVSLYAQYYDLIDETNFYLTVKQENDKYNFKKIDSKDMGEVYENLTKPYDELDKLKAKILFKE